MPTNVTAVPAASVQQPVVTDGQRVNLYDPFGQVPRGTFGSPAPPGASFGSFHAPQAHNAAGGRPFVETVVSDDDQSGRSGSVMSLNSRSTLATTATGRSRPASVNTGNIGTGHFVNGTTFYTPGGGNGDNAGGGTAI